MAFCWFIPVPDYIEFDNWPATRFWADTKVIKEINYNLELWYVKMAEELMEGSTNAEKAAKISMPYYKYIKLKREAGLTRA